MKDLLFYSAAKTACHSLPNLTPKILAYLKYIPSLSFGCVDKSEPNKQLNFRRCMQWKYAIKRPLTSEPRTRAWSQNVRCSGSAESTTESINSDADIAISNKAYSCVKVMST